MSNAAIRIITALIAAPVVVLLAYLGGWYFTGLVIVVALACQFELYRIAARADLNAQVAGGLALSLVILLRFVFDAWMAAAILIIIVMLVIELFRKHPHPLGNLSLSVFGSIYPAAMLGLLIDIRRADLGVIHQMDAFFLVLSILMVIWVTDTAAYYAGSGAGRRPLFPRISPKKTWEGSLAGVAGSVLITLVLKLTLLDFVPWHHAAAFALIGGVAGQVGDLVESLFKRSLDVKDSGGILPGHGGMLDRFDAMIFAVPLFYLYLRYIAGLI